MVIERAAIIIPTFNGARRIERCLQTLQNEIAGRDITIVVVDDGSTDSTCSVVGKYPNVRLITQANAGPAAARNRGVQESQGSILLFTDDDCEPAPGWLDAMLAPFEDSDVVGVKGVYRTRQRSLIARFVQNEYEDRYLRMKEFENIDFVDTYSAAFRREAFLETGGYDTSFTLACAEDIELSYRMSKRGWHMKFAPDAVVFHSHPATLFAYLKKKYKFAYWRMLALRNNPGKAIQDSHTPQLMKCQLLFAPLLMAAMVMDLIFGSTVPVSVCVLAAFLASTIPFAIRVARADLAVGVLSPLLLAFRSFAQFLGVSAGAVQAMRKPLSAGRAQSVGRQSGD